MNNGENMAQQGVINVEKDEINNIEILIVLQKENNEHHTVINIIYVSNKCLLIHKICDFYEKTIE